MIDFVIGLKVLDSGADSWAYIVDENLVVVVTNSAFKLKYLQTLGLLRSGIQYDPAFKQYFALVVRLSPITNKEYKALEPQIDAIWAFYRELKLSPFSPVEPQTARTDYVLAHSYRWTEFPAFKPALAFSEKLWLRKQIVWLYIDGKQDNWLKDKDGVIYPYDVIGWNEDTAE